MRCIRLTTLPPSCAVVMKSGNLNFLEPSGPLQACNGTALPLPKQVSDIFYRTVSFKFINFAFQIFLPFFLKCLLASCLTLFRLSTFIWVGFCNRCILACFLSSKNCKHSSSNNGLCFYHSYRPRLSLAEVLIFSLMFSQALFMSLLSFKTCLISKSVTVS